MTDLESLRSLLPKGKLKSPRKSGDYVIPNGQYKGKTIDYLIKEEPGYIKALVKHGSLRLKNKANDELRRELSNRRREAVLHQQTHRRKGPPAGFYHDNDFDHDDLNLWDISTEHGGLF